MSEVTVARTPTAGDKPGPGDQSSDRDDFDAFVAARGAALWRTAWLLTGDPHRAEDLVQTALGKAWPHWHRVSSGGSFEAYVRKVLFTTYVAWWRRKWNAEVPTAEPPESASDRSAVDDQVALQRDVARALAALPRGQRAVVVLRYFDDLTESQAAEVLACSVGTIKSQTAKALAALRSSPALARVEEDKHE